MTFCQCLVAKGKRQPWKRNGAWGNVLPDMHLSKYSPVFKTNWIKLMEVLESKIWLYTTACINLICSHIIVHPHKPTQGRQNIYLVQEFQTNYKGTNEETNIRFYLNVSYFVHYGLFALTLVCFPTQFILIIKWFCLLKHCACSMHPTHFTLFQSHSL